MIRHHFESAAEAQLLELVQHEHRRKSIDPDAARQTATLEDTYSGRFGYVVDAMSNLLGRIDKRLSELSR